MFQKHIASYLDYGGLGRNVDVRSGFSHRNVGLRLMSHLKNLKV